LAGNPENAPTVTFIVPFRVKNPASVLLRR